MSTTAPHNHSARAGTSNQGDRGEWTRLRFYPPRNALGVATGSTPIPTMKRFVPDHTKRRPLNFCALTGMIPPRQLIAGQAVGGCQSREEEDSATAFNVHRNFGAGGWAIYFWCAGDHGIPSEAQRGTVRLSSRWFGVAL